MRAWIVALALLAAATSSRAADNTDSLIARIKAVSDKGQGHKDAVAATAELSRCSPEKLPAILVAMNDAGPLARNWLRGAFETAATRSLQTPATFPKVALLGFFNDHNNNPAIRRLAFEWITKVDAGFAAKTIPESLADPSSEMRRDAVAFHIDRAKELAAKGDKDAAKAEWELALTGAGEEDQLKLISKTLKEDYSEDVDLIRHNGLIVDWHVIGPFDNKKMKGFDVAYPPEKEVDFSKTYPAEFEGMTNDLKWVRLKGENPDGKFEIAKLTSPY
ncbi:MAG TPA: hypothetical protein VM510_08150, partial [Caulifigura sp.]|nr:hypothetical protein [Caulifigura sp.]